MTMSVEAITPGTVKIHEMRRSPLPTKWVESAITVLDRLRSLPESAVVLRPTGLVDADDATRRVARSQTAMIYHNIAVRVPEVQVFTRVVHLPADNKFGAPAGWTSVFSFLDLRTQANFRKFQERDPSIQVESVF